MVCDGGVRTDDFAQIFSDMKRSVSYKVVTKTTDPMTGAEITTFVSASSVDLIFFLEENRYIWDKEGLLSVGDAYIIAPITTGIKRYDQFTIAGVTYFIENTIRRTILNTPMMDFATCFKVS